MEKYDMEHENDVQQGDGPATLLTWIVVIALAAAVLVAIGII